MAGTISGFTLTYTAVGGILLWSGIKGTTITQTFQDVLKGQAPTAAQNTEKIGVPTVTGSYGASGGGTGAGSTPAGSTPAGDSPAGSDNANLNIIGEQLYELYGYSRAAAAGIAGCVAGESGGNPESEGSGGDGLIGWTPPSKLTAEGGTFTGPGATAAQTTADLNSQIQAIDTYNRDNWPQYIAALNAQTDPVKAADFYSQNFERPKVTDSDVRAGVAESVYTFLGQGAPAQLGKQNPGGG